MCYIASPKLTRRPRSPSLLFPYPFIRFERLTFATHRQGKEVRRNYSRTKDLAAVCIIKVSSIGHPHRARFYPYSHIGQLVHLICLRVDHLCCHDAIVGSQLSRSNNFSACTMQTMSKDRRTILQKMQSKLDTRWVFSLR